MENKRRKISILVPLVVTLVFIVMVFFSNSSLEVHAFNIPGDEPQTMQYYVASRQNIAYWDLEENEIYEAYFELVHYRVCDNMIFPQLKNGFLIRNDSTVFEYSYETMLIENFNFNYIDAKMIFIITSNLDVYRYAIVNDTGEELFLDHETSDFLELDINYDLSNIDRNLIFYEYEFDENDVSNKIDESSYFENLNNNFGINNTGSCTYVSLGILLGYYDIFKNDNLINDSQTYLSGDAKLGSITESSVDTFISKEAYGSHNINYFPNSPGTTNAFHNFLVYEVGRNDLNYYNYELGESAVDGLSMQQTKNVLDKYLIDYVGLNHTQFSTTVLADEQQIINELNNNRPVLIGCSSWSMNYVLNFSATSQEDVISTYLNSGHALVAYGYEETDEGVYFKCHTGWELDNYNDYSESIILSFGDSEIEGLAFSLNTNHICSNAYIDNSSSNNQAFCPSCGNLTGNEYDIHCRSEDNENTVDLSNGKKTLLKLNVECPIQYRIEASAQNEVLMDIYNENMILIESGTTLELSSGKHIVYSYPLLAEGTYYVKIYFDSDDTTGDVEYLVRPYTSTDDYISMDDEVNVLTHLHDNKNEFIISPSQAGLFLLELTAVVDGEVVNPEGEFVIKNSSGAIIQKMNLSDYDHPAESITNANNIMFYANQWGGYTVFLEVAALDYDELKLYVHKIEDFTVYDMDENDRYSCDDNILLGDFATIYSLDRIGTYDIEFDYQGSQTNNMLFVLFETNENGEYVYKNAYEVNYNSNPITLTEEITYSKNLLLCVFDSEGLGKLNINISKQLDDNTFTIVTDPSTNMSGSEVKLNNGVLGGTTITKGFTRICYLGENAPNTTSRYTYYNWYSTNESVALVSAYGTITAVGVGKTTIQCVYKEDPTVIATLEITVISYSNTGTIYLNYGMDVRVGGTISGTEVTSGKGSAIAVSSSPSVSIHKGYTRLICLGDDSPNSSVQAFTWTAYREHNTDTGMVTVSQFGTITGTTSGWVTVKGVYKYNPNYEVYIRIYVE